MTTFSKWLILSSLLAIGIGCGGAGDSGTGGTGGTGGSGEGGTGGTGGATSDVAAPQDLRASRDDPAAIRLEWSMPEGGSAQSFVVFRDGTEIAKVAGAVRSFVDRGASPGDRLAPTVTATPGAEAVLLRWNEPGGGPGRDHEYRVVAVGESGRSPPSSPAFGARSAPAIKGYGIRRDGQRIGETGADTLVFEDLTARAPSPPRAIVQATPSDLGVDLSWSVPPDAGQAHSYLVDVLHDEGSSTSPAVEGRRQVPEVIGFTIERDGTRLADLPPDTHSYFDDTANVETAPPSGLVAEDVPVSGGIVLGWRPPAPVASAAHAYRVFTVLGQGANESNEVRSGRLLATPTGYVIFRDGVEVAQVPGDIFGWTDPSVDLELVTAPEVQVEADVAKVRLSWGPSTRRNATHGYEIVALFDGARSESSGVVNAARDQAFVVRYRVVVDGVEAQPVAPDVRAYSVDVEPGEVVPPVLSATQGTSTDLVRLDWLPGELHPGPLHRFEVSAVLSFGEGPSTEVMAGAETHDPATGKYEVLRDGQLVATLNHPGQTSWEDPGAAPGAMTAPEVTATSDRTDGVRIDWSPPEVIHGRHHVYEVALAFGEDRFASNPATGFRAPTFDRYEVARDGAQIATLGPGETSFWDPSSSAGAPRNLVASTTYEDAVALSWAPPGAESHTYRVTATDGLSNASSGTAVGTRMPPPIVGYEFSRNDGVEWHPAGSVPAYNDTEAVKGRIYFNYNNFNDPPRFEEWTGNVNFRSSGGRLYDVLPADPSPYRVRAITEAGPGQASVAALGRRAVSMNGIVTTWQRSTQDASDGPYFDVAPCCATRATSTLALDEARWFRARAESPSAVGTSAARRFERKRFYAVSTGERHTCGLWGGGIAVCWGSEVSYALSEMGPYTSVLAGYLGTTYVTDSNGTRPRKYLPSTRVLPADHYVAIADGWDHTCGLRASDHRVTCVGSNDVGQTNAPSSFFETISASEDYTCGILQTGELRCWGRAPSGMPTGTFSELAAGYEHACAIATDGSIRCWGRDGSGETTPPNGTDWIAIRTGYQRSCAMRSDGTITCWGSWTWSGFTGPEGTFVQFDLKSTHACAVSVDGELVCWGSSVPNPY